jgi:hypothetical protein
VVLFATDKRAYLNRGVVDGLAAGQSIALIRRGRSVGTCTVETVFDHHATCTGAHPKAGDGFHASAGTVARPRAVLLSSLAPVEDEQTLRVRAQTLAEATYEKVDFNHAHASVSRVRATLVPEFVLWHSGSNPDGDTMLERLDGAVQAYDMGGSGLDFSAAFSAMRWQTRADTSRFRPNSQTQFYLWEAEVTRRHEDANTVVAVGRMWPWHTPGLTMLDGVQIGRRNRSRSAEAGIYAGMLPLALSTWPSSDSWATGAYGTMVQTGSKDGSFRLLREEARLGVWSQPSTKLVTDADLLTQAWMGIWNLSLGGRALLAPSVRSGVQLDRAVLTLGARPTARAGANLHLRYLGAPLPATVTLVGEIPTSRGLLSAYADTFWNVSAGISLRAFGSFNQERDTRQWIATSGAEVRWPRVFDGLAVGGEGETGWMRGGLVYGQLANRFGERLHLLSRLSISASEFRTTPSAASLAELGGYLHLEGALATWVRLRAWSTLRMPFLFNGDLSRQVNYGVAFGSSLTGVF